jgi:hypothetical protein
LTGQCCFGCVARMRRSSAQPEQRRKCQNSISALSKIEFGLADHGAAPQQDIAKLNLIY